MFGSRSLLFHRKTTIKKRNLTVILIIDRKKHDIPLPLFILNDIHIKKSQRSDSYLDHIEINKGHESNSSFLCNPKIKANKRYSRRFAQRKSYHNPKHRPTHHVNHNILCYHKHR